VPFLIKYPELPKCNPRETDAFIDAQDIMPTLLGLCGINIPDSVESVDFSKHICGEDNPADDAALIFCPHPFGQWLKPNGGREYRGLRTKRYTYCRDLNKPWLLYDNEKDPYQLNNLVSSSDHNEILRSLDELLSKKLEEANDEFLPGMEYIKKWGYKVDEDGTVPYTP
ncbi:MAG: sulfatase, partial [Chlamydiae bacterium]